jgi:hypothetical protein
MERPLRSNRNDCYAERLSGKTNKDNGSDSRYPSTKRRRQGHFPSLSSRPSYPLRLSLLHSTLLHPISRSNHILSHSLCHLTQAYPTVQKGEASYQNTKMESKTSARKCEACKNCQPMFPKPVERSAMTARAVAPLATRHVCEKHGHAHSHKSSAEGSAAGSCTSRSSSKSRGHAVSADIDLSQLPVAPTSSDDRSPPSSTDTDPASLESPVDLDFEDRLDAAIAATTNMIAEAQAQLAELPLPGTSSFLADSPTSSQADVTDTSSDTPLGLSGIVQVYDYTPDSTVRRSRTSKTEEMVDEPTSPQSDSWFDAEEHSVSDISSVHLPATPASTAGAEQSQTEAPAPVARASAHTSTVVRAPGKQAPRKQKAQQGWHTLWSVDYSAKW